MAWQAPLQNTRPCRRGKRGVAHGEHADHAGGLEAGARREVHADRVGLGLRRAARRQRDQHGVHRVKHARAAVEHQRGGDAQRQRHRGRCHALRAVPCQHVRHLVRDDGRELVLAGQQVHDACTHVGRNACETAEALAGRSVPLGWYVHNCGGRVSSCWGKLQNSL